MKEEERLGTLCWTFCPRQGGQSVPYEFQNVKKKILRSTHLPNVASLPSLVCLAFCPLLLWLVCRSKVHARGVIVVSGKHTVTPCGNLAPSGDEWR